MTTISIPIAQIQAFFLIFLRVSALIFTLPVLGSRNIPIIVKAWFSLSLSFVLFPILDAPSTFLTQPVPLVIGIFVEILLGAVIGLSVWMFFAGIQLAGQMIGFQMGLGIANVMDPISNSQSSVVAQLTNLFAMFIFLAADGHHEFLKALVKSFDLVPILDFQYSTPLIGHLIKLAGDMFIIAVKVGAPVMIILLLTSAALGLVARTVPQMNIFIVAFPVKIVIGFVFLALSFPLLSVLLRRIFDGFSEGIILMLKGM